MADAKEKAGQVTDVYGLRSAYYSKHPDGHFFDRDTLKFFGERLSRMYLSKKLHQVKDSLGNWHTCYELSSQQSYSIPGCGMVKRRVYHYFDVDTLEDIC